MNRFDELQIELGRLIDSRRAETGSLYLDQGDIRVADHEQLYGGATINIIMDDRDHISSAEIRFDLDRFNGDMAALADSVLQLARRMASNQRREDD